jgi:Ca2+/Na+ antiporter
MMTYVMACLAVVCTIATFALQSGRRILSFVAAGFWVITGVSAYTTSVKLWDIYYALFWLCMAMVIVCALIPSVLKEKQEESDQDIDQLDEADRPLYEDIKKSQKDKDNYDMLFGKRKVHKKTSHFAKTGEIGRKE